MKEYSTKDALAYLASRGVTITERKLRAKVISPIGIYAPDVAHDLDRDFVPANKRSGKWYFQQQDLDAYIQTVKPKKTDYTNLIIAIVVGAVITWIVAQ